MLYVLVILLRGHAINVVSECIINFGMQKNEAGRNLQDVVPAELVTSNPISVQHVEKVG